MVLATGCSFLAADTPTKLPVENPYYECSVGAPVIDTVVGVPLAAVAVGLFAVGFVTENGLAGYAALPATIAIPYSIGAIYGWHDHARCKKLMAAPDHDWALAYASYAERLADEGKCAEAWAIATKVDARDHEVYIHGFLERPGMLLCRGAARQAQEATALEGEVANGTAEQRERRTEAVAMAKRARDAAKQDGCEEARALTRKIEELDPKVYTTWVANDPDIARCLAPSTDPTPTPAP